MDVERRKGIYEFWLKPEDLLALPDVWIEAGQCDVWQSTHEMANAGLHCKITSNQKAFPNTRVPSVYENQYSTYSTLTPILSEKIINPLHGLGTTSIRFHRPFVGHKVYNFKIRLYGFHYCPETVWQDLLCYDYYRASFSLNIKIMPKNPDLKAAEMILDKIPFSLFQEAHNKRMLEELGDYRSDKAKKKAEVQKKSKLITENIIDLSEIRDKKQPITREEVLEILELTELSA